MSTGYMTFLEDVKGFAWNNPPANNFVDTLVFEKLKQLQILPSEHLQLTKSSSAAPISMRPAACPTPRRRSPS